MAKPWRIEWQGQRWSVDDLGAAGMLACQHMVDDGWESFDPTRSPAHLAAVAGVLIAAATATKIEDACAVVAAMSSAEFLALLQYHEGGDG